MDGKPTFHYFQLYAKGEPIRMALWKAGVEFNDNRVTGDDWKALKASGKLPYGSMPALELADGTMIAQQLTIMNYLAEVHKSLRSDDPLKNAKAYMLTQHLFADIFFNIGPKTFSKEDNRVDVLKGAADKYFPTLFKGVSQTLAGQKFLTGDNVTIYDIQICGFFCNLLHNPNSKDYAMW